MIHKNKINFFSFYRWKDCRDAKEKNKNLNLKQGNSSDSLILTNCFFYGGKIVGGRWKVVLIFPPISIKIKISSY